MEKPLAIKIQYMSTNLLAHIILSLQLTDEHECVDEKMVVLKCKVLIYLSTNGKKCSMLFSPNGDGINDSFSFEENNAISEFSVKIFNRWGSLVYSWTDPNFKWNGLSFDGDNLTQGVYYYYMNAIGQDGQLYEKKVL